MKIETAYLHYAHCVKFTEGALDRSPYSEYELREIPVAIARHEDDEGISWTVSDWRKVIGSGEEREEALAGAAYLLMDESRHLAGKGGAFLQAMKGGQ